MDFFAASFVVDIVQAYVALFACLLAYPNGDDSYTKQQLIVFAS